MTREAITQELDRCLAGSRILRNAGALTRGKVLEALEILIAQREKEILAANEKDLKALPADATAAFRDRLQITPARLQGARDSIRAVAQEADPVGEELESRRLPNGLLLRRVLGPLGVLFLVFESRPNVAIEAFSLAIRSGNVIILRGGKESMHSTGVLYQIFQEAVTAAGLPAGCFWGITDPDRGIVKDLLGRNRHIDVVIPRGGESLIEFVMEHTTIPVIKNDRGLCHVYVHEDADQKMALEIVDNAKTQRPGVCNAMETVLIHRSLKNALIPALYERLAPKGVQWFGCAETTALLTGRPGVSPATDKHFATEYLDLILNCRVVSSLAEAIQHIERFGSRHSEAIITLKEETARQFQNAIDAAAVYWNASTRFTDGFAFGLGGEIGISTQKLHVRGPVGVKQLTTARWLIDGTGQIR